MSSDRILRSWMFVPGNKQRFLEKAESLAMDAVIFDLEDGVPADAKELGRQQIAAAIEDGRIAAAKYVRVNEVGTGWFDRDLKVVLVPGVDGLLLPKVESPAEVVEASRRLGEWERSAELAVGSTELVIAIESSLGLLRAPDIASASPRVSALMLGTEDFALDMGLSARRVGESLELVYARSALVVAARSVRILVVDGVFPDYSDLEGLEQDVAQARRLGYDGKTLFHPGQIEDINRLFSPTEEEIAYAQEIVQAFDDAIERGDGAVAVGGQLVDLPIVLRARRTLATAG